MNQNPPVEPLLEALRFLIGVGADLHAQEHREAEADAGAPQRGAVAVDIAVALEALHPPEAG